METGELNVKITPGDALVPSPELMHCQLPPGIREFAVLLQFGLTKQSPIQQKKSTAGEGASGGSFATVGEAMADVTDPASVARFARLIEQTRVAKSHKLNDRSSRSHCLVRLHVTKMDGNGKVPFISDATYSAAAADSDGNNDCGDGGGGGDDDEDDDDNEEEQEEEGDYDYGDGNGDGDGDGNDNVDGNGNYDDDDDDARKTTVPTDDFYSCPCRCR